MSKKQLLKNSSVMSLIRFNNVLRRSVSKILSRKYLYLLLLLILWSIIYPVDLGRLSLFNCETYRVGVAIEIKEYKDLFNPVYNGSSYYAKPSIFSYVIHLFFECANIYSEAIARLPNALLVGLVIISSYFLLSFLGITLAASISTAFLVLYGVFHYGRSAEIDFFFSGIIYLSLIIIIRHRFYKKSLLNIIFCGVLQGVAFLIKGPFGLAMLFGLMFLFVIRKYGDLRSVLLELFSILVIVVAVVSVYATQLLFFHPYAASIWLHEISIRFFSPFDAKQLFYERLRALFYFFPFSPFIYIGLSGIDKERLKLIYELTVYLFVLILCLFLMPGFQSQYIMPVVCFSSIPVGLILGSQLEKRVLKKFFLFCGTGFVLCFCMVYIIFPQISEYRGTRSVSHQFLEVISQESNTIPIIVDESESDVIPYLRMAKLKNNIIYHSSGRSTTFSGVLYYISAGSDKFCRQYDNVRLLRVGYAQRGFLMNKEKVCLFLISNPKLK